MRYSKLIIDNRMVTCFQSYLVERECSESTVTKYVRDVCRLEQFAGGDEITQKVVLKYKENLQLKYKLTTVNSMLASINCFFKFINRRDLAVCHFKIQRTMFRNEAELLTRKEYMSMLDVAQNTCNNRMSYVMQTICATGIRVSELEYITVEAVLKGVAQVNCKGKIRTIIVPKKLCNLLLSYCRMNGVKSGSVFVTSGGNPLNRSNIWRDMKRIGREAGVSPTKIYPHNLRHLFAQTFYDKERDIVKLADILGHSSIQTTRIYTASSYKEQMRTIDELNLI